MPLKEFNNKNKKDKKFSFFHSFKHKKPKLKEKVEISSKSFKEFWEQFQKKQLLKISKQKEFSEKSEKFKQAWEQFQEEHLRIILYLAFKHGSKIIPDLLTKKYLLLPIHLYSLLFDIGEQYDIKFPFLEKINEFSALKDYEQLEIIRKMLETLYEAKSIQKLLKDFKN